MKKVKSIVFVCLTLWLAVVADGFGQTCSAAFDQGASVNISYCASSCSNQTATVTVSCSGGGSVVSYDFQTKGGIEKVSQSVSGNVYTITYKSIAGSFCKGRIVFKYSTAYCVDKTVSMDVFKCFSKTDLNTAWNNLYATSTGLGSIGYEVIGPNCAKNGELVTFSVTPLLSCNISDEIGVDDYVWNFPFSWGTSSTAAVPFWAAGDNSSVTLRIPASFDWSTLSSNTAVITCRPGKCNTAMSPLPRKQVIQAPQPFYLTFASSNGSKAYSTYQGPPIAATGYACIDADFGTNSTDWITISGSNSPAQPEWDGKWQWTAPDGFDVVNSSGVIIDISTVTGSTLRLRPRAGYAGANGTVVAAINGASCNKVTNSYIIHRKLVASPYNRISINTVFTNVCLRPAPVTYEARVDNGPNIPYTWTFSGLTTNSNGTASATTVNTNANSIVLYALTGASSASINVLGNNTLPLGVTGSACNYGTATTFPGTLSFPGLQSQTPDVSFNSATGVLGVTGLPGTCSPLGTHFNFSWTYTGWVALTSDLTKRQWVTNATTAVVNGSTVVIFEDPNDASPGSAIPGPKLKSNYTYCGSSAGTFNTASSATVNVSVSNKNSFPGGSTCALTCFQYNDSESIPGGAYRPGKGGGDDAAISHLEQELKEIGLHIVPNPNEGRFELQLEKGDKIGGTVEVVSPSGVVVYRAAVTGTAMQLNLSRKAKGLYSVRWINKEGAVQQKLILE